MQHILFLGAPTILIAHPGTSIDPNDQQTMRYETNNRFSLNQFPSLQQQKQITTMMDSDKDNTHQQQIDNKMKKDNILFNVPVLPPAQQTVAPTAIQPRQIAGTGLSKSGSAVGHQYQQQKLPQQQQHYYHYHHHYYPQQQQRQQLRHSATTKLKTNNNNMSSSTTKKTADSGFSSGSSGYVGAGSPPGGTFMLGSF